MANYTITSDDEFSGATVILDNGETLVIAGDNKNYSEVVRGLVEQDLTDDELVALIAPFAAIYSKLTKLSERVSRKGSRLLFDGDVVDNALTKFIIDAMNEGNDEVWKAYIAFMEKLYQNPSEESRKHFFHYIEDNGLQLTPDGDAVLYKGTKEDGKSTVQGYGIVNGVEVEHDYLQNSLGAIIEIPRSKVDPNRSSECSVGLHVGAFEYVTGRFHGTWPQMWTVLVNPRDVVAVPHDYQSSKIRVTRYVVVQDLGRTNQAKKHEGLIWSPPAPEVEEPEVEETSEPIEVDGTIYSKLLSESKKPEAAPAKTEYPEGSRVPEYITLIQSGGAGSNLKKFRNKRVTAGRRDEFDQAVEALGLTYG